MSASTASCSDGKTYLEVGSGYTGSYRYFDGELMVGVAYWSDVVSSECQPGAAMGELSCPGASRATKICP